MTVTFVNLFEVEPERDDAFLALWREVNDYMSTKPGYLGHAFHRALSGPSPYRYVNVVVWVSAELHGAAHDEGFRALVAQPEWRRYGYTPGLYEVVHSGQA